MSTQERDPDDIDPDDTPDVPGDTEDEDAVDLPVDDVDALPPDEGDEDAVLKEETDNG